MNNVKETNLKITPSSTWEEKNSSRPAAITEDILKALDKYKEIKQEVMNQIEIVANPVVTEPINIEQNPVIPEEMQKMDEPIVGKTELNGINSINSNPVVGVEEIKEQPVVDITTMNNEENLEVTQNPVTFVEVPLNTSKDIVKEGTSEPRIEKVAGEEINPEILNQPFGEETAQIVEDSTNITEEEKEVKYEDVISLFEELSDKFINELEAYKKSTNANFERIQEELKQETERRKIAEENRVKTIEDQKEKLQELASNIQPVEEEKNELQGEGLENSSEIEKPMVRKLETPIPDQFSNIEQTNNFEEGPLGAFGPIQDIPEQPIETPNVMGFPS